MKLGVIHMQKPVITMTTLGKNGRFGNQFFQYTFLKVYEKIFDLQVETPKWIGNYLFNARDPLVNKSYPVVSDSMFNKWCNNNFIGTIDEKAFLSASAPFTNVDFWGYFIFNTRAYLPYKDYILSLYKPLRMFESFLQKGLEILRAKGKTIIGIHLRRGDYLYYKNTDSKAVYYVTPTSLYKELLAQIWPELEKPVLFIASDDLDSVIQDFSEYNPITSNDLFDRNEINKLFPQCDFYPDFYLLSKCDVMAISNSSFSYSASMLNVNCKSFYRPVYKTKSLIPYDPWNSTIYAVDNMDY